MVDKRFKVTINEVERENKILNTKQIQNRLRQKWVKSVIDNSDELNIEIFSTTFNQSFTQRSGWLIKGSGETAIIQLKDCVGNVQEYDIDKMLQERESKKHTKSIDLFEDVIAQAELIYLSGNFKDFECAFNHIKNRIEYDKRSIRK